MKGKSMKIRLDAAYDLNVAGYPADDELVEQLTAAYCEAAQREAEERGIEIEIVVPGDPEYHEGRTAEERDAENEIWQAIHDRLNLIDGEWA
jgi:hypothetical protein